MKGNGKSQWGILNPVTSDGLVDSKYPGLLLMKTSPASSCHSLQQCVQLKPSHHDKDLIIMSDDHLCYEGIPFPRVFCSPEILRKAREEFVMKDEDVVTVTFLKSETNWLVEILHLIHSKWDTKWVQSVPIWERSTWLETEAGFALANKKEEPTFAHLPPPHPSLPQVFLQFQGQGDLCREKSQRCYCIHLFFLEFNHLD
ncbi:sulfotransferase 2A8-like [Nycticebus coucang]|uniref:sulfotransferase 2A8-like n=1 Tax=Nycticebus coucang TaxID=9470 RepID=UPI00234C2606|nr:sulfotransferase 2A8-like [Nycticebus coucang]